MSEETLIAISELEVLVSVDKTQSSARNYLAMLKSLRIYLGGDNTLSTNQITPSFVQGFGDSMLDRDVAPSTAKLYKQMLRAVLNKRLGKGYKELIKAAFKDTDSDNETATRLLGPEEVTAIASSELNSSSLLKKVRDLFMFSFYGGAMSLGHIKALASDDFTSTDLLPQQKEIVRKFPPQYGMRFCEYVLAITDETYARRLDAIGQLLKLKVPLTPQSSADAWIKTARKCGFGQDIIASCLRTSTSYIQAPVNNPDHSYEHAQYYQAVANSVCNVVPRWYVMRCCDLSPAALSKQLNNPDGKSSDILLETFFPVLPSGKYGNRMSVISDMLFFRSSHATACHLKKSLWPKAYVYSNRSTGLPSFIPDDEMRMFMLLSNIASDTIEYYFPDVNYNLPEFNTNDTVTVIDGNLCGQVGVVQKLSDDRLKVFIKIEALNGAIITAEIHKSFLKTCDS